MRNWINLIVESSFADSGFFKEFDLFMGNDCDSPDDEEFNWSTGAVTVSLADKGPSTLELRFIQIDDEERRRGEGTKIMTELCRLADKYRIKIILVADESNDAEEDDDEDGESDYDERDHWLQGWYSRLGFDYTGDTSDYGPWMERKPRA